MEESESLIAYYRQRAPEYEQIYYRDWPERRKEIDDEAERLKAFVTGKSVLDLACGTGYWTEVMSATASDITALDLSPEMIAEAQKKSYSCPVYFVRGSLEQIPFADSSFDVVTLGFWFSHEPRQTHANLLERIGRLPKCDGSIWMIDNCPVGKGAAENSVEIDTFGNSFKKRFLKNGKEFKIIKNYFSAEELRDIFTPYFAIRDLAYKNYYWSVILKVTGGERRQ